MKSAILYQNRNIYRFVFLIISILIYSSSHVYSADRVRYVENLKNYEDFQCHIFRNKTPDNPLWLTTPYGKFDSTDNIEIIALKMCMCNNEFTYFKISCKAFTSPHCQCINFGKVDNYKHKFKNMNGVFMGKWKDPETGKEKIYQSSFVVGFSYRLSSDAKIMYKNPVVSTNVDWEWKWEKRHQFFQTEHTVSNRQIEYKFCGDGKIQTEEGEKCDDGLNNGKIGYCNSECSK